jgi:hypothetical protein
MSDIFEDRVPDTILSYKSFIMLAKYKEFLLRTQYLHDTLSYSIWEMIGKREWKAEMKDKNMYLKYSEDIHPLDIMSKCNISSTISFIDDIEGFTHCMLFYEYDGIRDLYEGLMTLSKE